MPKDLNPIEVVEARIVTCTRCGAKNRLYKQRRGLSHRCGSCKTPLPNPFNSPRVTDFLASISDRLENFFLPIPINTVYVGCIFLIAISVVWYLSPSKAGTDAALDFFSTSGSNTSSQNGPSLPPLKRSLPNGSKEYLWAQSGDGRLSIQNGNGNDAYIKLIDESSKQTVARIYICASSEAHLEGVPDGTYFVLFATGVDWDDQLKRFTREMRSQRFDDTFHFITTTEIRGATEVYHTSEILLTLHPMAGGKAHTRRMSIEEFLRL